MPTAHFIRHMKEEQTTCGKWLITLSFTKGAKVYNINFTSPEAASERGESPCVRCLERLPLLDLRETEL